MLEVKIYGKWYKVTHLLDGEQIWCPGVMCGGTDLDCNTCPYNTPVGTIKEGEKEITRGEFNNENNK